MGLNLTAADTVIHFDPWWNPASENQATDRAYRIGQDKPVFVFKLITRGRWKRRFSCCSRKGGAGGQLAGRRLPGSGGLATKKSRHCLRRCLESAGVEAAPSAACTGLFASVPAKRPARSIDQLSVLQRTQCLQPARLLTVIGPRKPLPAHTRNPRRRLDLHALCRTQRQLCRRPVIAYQAHVTAGA